MSIRSPSLSVSPRARTRVGSYRVAYAVAVAGALTSALLTYLFVTDATPAVREGAPAMAFIIQTFGWQAMLVVKGAVLITLYSVVLPSAVRSTREAFEWISPSVARRCAWALALFCAFDAAWDLRATAHLEPPTLTLSPTAFATTLLVLLVALVVLTPPRRFDSEMQNRTDP